MGILEWLECNIDETEEEATLFIMLSYFVQLLPQAGPASRATLGCSRMQHQASSRSSLCVLLAVASAPATPTMQCCKARRCCHQSAEMHLRSSCCREQSSRDNDGGVAGCSQEIKCLLL